MKHVFKFGMMFFLIYLGLKSGISFVKSEFPSNGSYIDLIIFFLFIAFPASQYWGYSIENAFKEEPQENENNEENN